ncbi:hypothetical protein HPP92_009019 [Vanilla planifolia]|uniref:Uncharacterized protein n=1 Tax=Vanilla planifolia TaxID=51239 RepID=A0A835V4B1_VANPL|nr:hypothetical protein HPP92_009019 [Vanilla planifolia]
MELLSQMWSLLGLMAVLQNVLPAQLLSILHSLWQTVQDSLTPYSYFDVPEFLGSASVDPNELYRHVHLYLHRRLLLHPPSPPPRLTLCSSPASFSLSPNNSVEDSFSGHRILWTHHSDTLQDSLEERRSFSLRLPKRHSPSLLLPYLSQLSAAARDIDLSSRDRRIYTNSSASSHCSWTSVPFRHPATFLTLALPPDLPRLLPPRTSGIRQVLLIAAMANHLAYDVYDLELTRVPHNSALKSLLLQTTPRSIIVIEDIDCSLRLTADRRRSKKRKASTSPPCSDEDEESGERVTLSGLLNFTDGLWSCCGEERIVVFTTNYKQQIDPALLRPGRMDVHVQLGPCGSHVLREMVLRYIGEAAAEEMMPVAERSLADGATMTPAEVGEVLLRNRDAPETAVRELIAELNARICSEEVEEGWIEEVEEEDGVWPGKEKRRRGGSDGIVAEVGRGRGGGWERRVRFLGRVRSLTKSDSGRRGV